jgi:hypothetical protein
LGLFAGALAGAIVTAHFGENIMFAACVGLTLLWLGVHFYSKGIE